jgi:hypothetical protein
MITKGPFILQPLEMICLREMSGLLFFEGCGTADSPSSAVDSSAAFSSHSCQKTAFPFLLNMTYTMIFHNLSLFIFNNN